MEKEVGRQRELGAVRLERGEDPIGDRERVPQQEPQVCHRGDGDGDEAEQEPGPERAHAATLSSTNSTTGG